MCAVVKLIADDGSALLPNVHLEMDGRNFNLHAQRASQATACVKVSV